jgi:hypothetical protein
MENSNAGVYIMSYDDKGNILTRKNNFIYMSISMYFYIQEKSKASSKRRPTPSVLGH